MEKVLLQSSVFNFSWKGEAWRYSEGLSEQAREVKVFIEKPDKSCVEFFSGCHDSVYTFGKSVEFSVNSFKGIPVERTERGGRVMYHGPGQLTFYFIFNLKDYFSGARDYVSFLLNTSRDRLNERYGEFDLCDSGIWKGNNKVGFVGLRVKNGVVYHGISLNYSVDLEPFRAFAPCNISGERVGNILDSKSLGLNFRNEALAFREYFESKWPDQRANSSILH